jgi:hypothetical protein
MKTVWRVSPILLLLLGFAPNTWAGQQVYLSESPNGKYRVLVEQAVDRRVGDRIFFRYPIRLINSKNPKRHFEIRDAAPPLVQETEKGTFQVRWDGADSREPSSIRFNWSPDSLRFFMGLEVIKGTWKTFFVDVNTGITRDITMDLQKELVGKTDSKGWDCEQPRIQFVQWTKPHLAFLKLTSVCGKSREMANEGHFFLRDSVLFDTLEGRTVLHCLDCKDEVALLKFELHFLKSLPTPTPTPEETPTMQ